MLTRPRSQAERREKEVELQPNFEERLERFLIHFIYVDAFIRVRENKNRRKREVIFSGCNLTTRRSRQRQREVADRLLRKHPTAQHDARSSFSNPGQALKTLREYGEFWSLDQVDIKAACMITGLPSGSSWNATGLGLECDTQV
jgi:hypothetical protein